MKSSARVTNKNESIAHSTNTAGINWKQQNRAVFDRVPPATWLIWGAFELTISGRDSTEAYFFVRT